MNRHFTPEEFTDALDDVLEAGRELHLRECETCARELAAIREIARESKSLDAAEPSPLFWEHFTARVRRATEAEPERRWWNVGWRPLGALATAVGAIALVLILKPAAPTDAPADELAQARPLTEPFEDDGTWSLLVGLASELEAGDVRQATAPAAGTADLMIEELTGEQREALALLLQKGIGDLE